MSFARPEGLWLLSLAIPIVAFHFYRGRIKRLPVPTLLFWEQVLVEEETKSALRKLKHYVSLLMNLIALTVLTSAVSDPKVQGLSAEPRKIALVIDTSPAMLAREPDGRTRLDRARDEARAWLDAADEAALYDGAGLREALTTDLERVRRALGAVRVRAQSEASSIAEVLKRTRPDLQIVLLSGGAQVPNRGWTSGTCIRASGARFPTVRLRTEGGEREERVLVRWNGEALAERNVPPNAEFEEPLDPSKHPGRKLELGGVLEIAYAEPDAFPIDDAAFFVVPSSAPVPVVVFHREAPDPVLLRALDVLASHGLVGEHPAVSITKYAQARSALVEGTAVIFDRCSPPEPVMAGSVLQFGAGGAALEMPLVSDWDRAGPLLEGADLTHLAVQRASLLRGDVLIDSTAGPIAVQARRAGLAQVTFGFSLDLRESDFALRAAFPIFLRNWIEWTRRDATRAFPLASRFGMPLSPTAPWLREGVFLVAGPRGELAHAVRGGAVADPIVPDWPGIYRVSAAGRQEFIAVNFFERTPLAEKPSTTPPAPPPPPWYRRIPYAVVAAAIVLALLMAEWYFFHRGWI